MRQKKPTFVDIDLIVQNKKKKGKNKRNGEKQTNVLPEIFGIDQIIIDKCITF